MNRPVSIPLSSAGVLLAVLGSSALARAGEGGKSAPPPRRWGVGAAGGWRVDTSSFGAADRLGGVAALQVGHYFGPLAVHLRTQLGLSSKQLYLRGMAYAGWEQRVWWRLKLFGLFGIGAAAYRVSNGLDHAWAAALVLHPMLGAAVVLGAVEIRAELISLPIIWGGLWLLDVEQTLGAMYRF